jgi:putative heme-binding domain-containing protein
LATTSGALAVVRAVEMGELPDDSVKEVAVKTKTLEVGPVRDLFERFIPYEQRVKRLGTTVRPEEILVLKGDASRGKELFATGAGVQCRNCHKLGEVGTVIGPDLSTIARTNSREQLLESILEPSKKIDAKFVTYAVETADGEVFSGILVEKSSGHALFKDAKNKDLRIPTNKIETMVAQRASLMPDLLARDLTAQQLADLLEYLANLK